MENYLAGVRVQPLGCFELPIQAVFPLRIVPKVSVAFRSAKVARTTSWFPRFAGNATRPTT